MKKSVCIFCLVLIFISCKNEKEGDRSPDSATLVVPDSLLVYEVDAESKTKKPFTEIPGDSITVQHVVNGLNQKYPEVQMQVLKVGNDTVYVTFSDNGEFLGERMGSAGSSAYIADAILNLTGVKGINAVRIEMPRHSHVSPGVFTKQNFQDFKEVQ